MPSFWDKIRADFPITKKFTYLDHAAGGPIARPVLEALQRHQDENVLESDFAWMKWVRRREEVRAKVARFIHAEPGEVTFVSSTSQGMNFVAEMLASQGSVLTNTLEFPSSTVPWLWRKADLIWQQGEAGAVSLEKLASLLSPRVRTIVTSYVQYGSGYRQDLESLGKLKGNRFLVVNATQAFGALPVDVKAWKADFMVTNSYKWCLAGYGGGILFLKKKWIKKFKPAGIGWRSMTEPERMDNRRLRPKTDASRYEWGCPNFPAIFAVGAAVDYFSEIGVRRIEKRILELTGRLIERLRKKKIDILSPLEPAHRSGIVIFKAGDPARLWKRLYHKKIFVSVRGGGIRVAPHFYNTEREIDRLVKNI